MDAEKATSWSPTMILNDTFLSTNRTSSMSAQYKEPMAARGFKVVAYITIMILAIAGNAFVISAMRRDRRGKLRKFTYLMITSIAVSDLLMAVVSIPERVTRVVSEDRWLIPGDGGLLLCKVVNFVEKVSISVSALHVMALAFHRFLAVFRPQSSSKVKNCRRAVVTIVLMWLLSALYWSPVLYYGGIQAVSDSQLYCKVRYFYPQWRMIYLAFLILLFAILVMVLILYVAIWLKLSCSETLRERQPVSVASVVRRKTTTMVAVMVASFYCCFLPYWIGWVICSYQNIFCNSVFTFISIYLTHASVAVNPLICLIFSRHYREFLKELVTYNYKSTKPDCRLNHRKATGKNPVDML